jgi:pimeloyl-ACP methyl ester carboxylesterase
LANELVIYARTLKRPAFVGHSMGGLLGLMVAARANDAMCATSYAGLPNKKLTRVDGAFHFLMLDQPAAFASILDTFLEGK